jgi:hypothetical protein
MGPNAGAMMHAGMSRPGPRGCMGIGMGAGMLGHAAGGSNHLFGGGGGGVRGNADSLDQVVWLHKMELSHLDRRL